MIKIGLTGGIGSGKSFVSSYLEAKGIPIVDADVISRKVLEIYPEILQKIASAFGEDVLQEDGTLNRRKLGSVVFGNDEKKNQLEDIIIPYIKKEAFYEIKHHESLGEPIVIFDAPTLIENELHHYMDVNVLVWVDQETQIKRVMMRDELSEKDVMNRILAQLSLDEKQKHVDYLIDNRGSREETLKQVEELLEKLGVER